MQNDLNLKSSIQVRQISVNELFQNIINALLEHHIPSPLSNRLMDPSMGSFFGPEQTTLGITYFGPAAGPEWAPM
jgi:hypothetical protein